MAFTPYLLHLIIIICIYAILSMSMNLALGYTGLINLAHIAFFALGAYTSALLAINLGISFWLAMIAGGLLAAIFGCLLSYPTVRLKGDYLVLGTLGFSIIVEAVLKNWSSVTRGPLGLPGIPKPELFGVVFRTPASYAFLCVFFATFIFFVLNLIVNSPFGRLMRAVRDDEMAAKTMGKNTIVVKAKVLALSAFFAGMAGSLYAHYITFIDPGTFSILEVVLILSMVLIGGTGSLWGSVAGAALLVLLPEPLRFLHLPSSIVGGMRQAIYALLLVIVVMKRPQGLFGEDTLNTIWKKIKRSKHGTS